MKRSCRVMLAVAVGIALAGGAHAEDTLEKVKKKGALVAGVTDDAPPFGFRQRDSGSIVGYDVDLVTALATKLGVKVELRAVTAANRLSKLLDGDVDILAANLTHSESHTRESVIDFSDHYLATGQRFLAKRGVIKAHKDLRGKKIGALGGTVSESCARERCENAEIVSLGDYEQGLQALQQGEIDALTADQVILADLLANLPRGDYEIPELQISEEQYHVGVRKGDPNFVEFVNTTIRDMRQSGAAKKLYDKWFEPREERTPAAYGAVIRKASARPRFFAVVLNGVLLPKSEASIFALDGTYIGKAKVASVLEDGFYLDVDEAQYDLVRPGFLVATNMTNEMAKDIVARHQDLLKSVKSDSEKEAERIRAEIEKEGIAKQQRAQEVDAARERSRLTVQEQRAIYFRRYGGFRY